MSGLIGTHQKTECVVAELERECERDSIQVARHLLGRHTQMSQGNIQKTI